MISDTTSLKKGVAIRYEQKLYFVQSVFFVSPGKGSAFYRTKLKEIVTGRTSEKTFKSGEKIELVETERKNATFLYKQSNKYVFLESETYEQHELTPEVIGEEIIRFLKQEAELMLLIIEEEVIAVNFIKTKMVFEVTHAPPAIKGDTVSNAYRPVKIETGADIQAPLFIQTGDKIVINTDTGEYSERYKE
ncbi:elongation factor P [Spirochaetota bacterium]|nr:elongation factor P [Spirochaetota bacterium]